MIGFTRKEFINYAVLPGFRPRLQELFASGFHHVSYFMALVYQAVRLLPPNHPYLNPQNMGRFGIRHVIGEAANNLVIDVKNIDQILLFFTILFGMALIFIQFALLGFALLFQPVMAATMPTSFAGFFLTPAANEAQDLAHIMLDLVFGVPDIFNSCVSTGSTCLLDIDVQVAGNDDGRDDPWAGAGLTWPFPIHVALHQMFQLYSIGLLIVATFITVYFMFTVIAETAQTGTAFGKRFNKVWAPIRIVVAFGLLIPISSGLNSAQYIVLYAAKFGSGFATNGWTIFNQEITESYLGATTDLVTRPNSPEITPLLQFLFTARTCAELENFIPRDPPLSPIEPWLVKDPVAAVNARMLDQNYGSGPYTPYEELIAFADGASSVTIRFGRRNEQEYSGELGFVKPVCGELTFPLSDPRVPGSANPPEYGYEIMQRYFWFAIQDLWYFYMFSDPDFGGENFPYNIAVEYTPYIQGPVILPSKEVGPSLQAFFTQDIIDVLEGTGGITVTTGLSTGAVDGQAASNTWLANSDVLEQKGWAGAGIWYNRIAELNGTISAAVSGVPSVSRYPEIMEYVLLRKMQHNANIDLKTRFEPELSDADIPANKPHTGPFANAMWAAYDYWQSDSGAMTSHTQSTDNVLVDTINALLGTEGLYSMRRNPDAHPLAQLVGVGKSFIDASINNLADSAVLAVIGAGIGGDATLSAIIGLVMTIVTISLTVGFILFYVVPFLPFIYFFFAVGGWIKGIFEAMVGAPLWALAHIRIDGNGLPGQAAVNGYFLIFEIFLRPILIVFGLLASISIFSAIVSVMNETWDLVVKNLGGFDVRCEIDTANCDGTTAIEFLRGPIDEFFFTVVYTIIVYLMAMSSFKSIDLIPNNILRWMGQSISTFNDQREDAAAGLTGKATVGAQQTVGSVGGGLKGGLQGLANTKMMG